jgi:hypothetical protein
MNLVYTPKPYLLKASFYIFFVSRASIPAMRPTTSDAMLKLRMCVGIAYHLYSPIRLHSQQTRYPFFNLLGYLSSTYTFLPSSFSHYTCFHSPSFLCVLHTHNLSLTMTRDKGSGYEDPALCVFLQPPTRFSLWCW